MSAHPANTAGCCDEHGQAWACGNIRDGAHVLPGRDTFCPCCFIRTRCAEHSPDALAEWDATLGGHRGPAHGAIEADFALFHEANPHVYDRLVRLARGWKRRRPGQHVGMKMLFEVLRWQVAMETSDPSSDFKLNNNYTALYARLIMDREPDLDGLFETRRLHAPGMTERQAA
jgi:hypothetical protein